MNKAQHGNLLRFGCSTDNSFHSELIHRHQTPNKNIAQSNKVWCQNPLCSTPGNGEVRDRAAHAAPANGRRPAAPTKALARSCFVLLGEPLVRSEIQTRNVL